MTHHHYNAFAGRSLERLNALSDGVFAFAMTVIVLDIRVPDHSRIHGEADLLAALVALTPQFVTYLLSFLTLGIYWVAQQTQLHHFREADRNLSWIHLIFLAAVAVLPLSTRLLASFITYRVALLVYWGNILVLGVLLLAAFAYAERAGLLKAERPVNLSQAFRHRIITAQVLYAIGAALCLINTYWSIGFIVLVQIYYAAAPRIRFLHWID